MKHVFACLTVLFSCLLTGCLHRAASNEPAPADCPVPDVAGMSSRLAERFFRMREDTLQRPWLIKEGVRVDELTPPVLVRDRATCGRIAAALGIAQGDASMTAKAEGGAYYRLGPHVVYSPWRDYNRRVEWRNKSEFVGLVVLGADLKVLMAIAM